MCLPSPPLLAVSWCAGLKFLSQTEMVSFWATRSVCAFYFFAIIHYLFTEQSQISNESLEIVRKDSSRVTFLLNFQIQFFPTSLYLLSPHWIRWCTKRRTLTVQSTSGQWRGTPPTASSWLVWGNMCSMRSRFWLSQGLEMDGPVLHPSWRGLWMMVGTYDSAVK